MLSVVNDHRLFAPGRHENFDRVVTVAVGTLVEGALNALVCCVLWDLPRRVPA